MLLLVPRTTKLDGQCFHELSRLPEQRLRVTGAVDVFLFTGAETDNHFFVEETKRAGQSDRGPTEPHFTGFFGNTILPIAPAFHNPVDPLLLLREE